MRKAGRLRLAVNAAGLPEKIAGIGFYTRMLLPAMLDLDPGLEIILFTGTGAALGFSDFIHPRFRIHPLPIHTTLAKALAIQFFLPFRLGGFDLVHSVGNVPVLLSGARQVVTIHDICQRFFPERFGAVKRAYLNVGQSWGARMDLEAIAVSRRTRDDLLGYHPGYGKKITVVHSASKFAVDRTDPGPRRDFLFVGTLEPGKNLPLAIEALGMLKREHGLEKRMVVAGAQGWRQTRLPEDLARAGVERQVDFLGYLPDAELREWYRRAECLIFPSIYEGFGLPILEAQSQGCPVIAADNSSLREVGGEGCHYFPTQNARALCDLLLRSQRESAAFSAVRAAGYGNCEKYSWTETARQTLEVYRRALAHP